MRHIGLEICSESDSISRPVCQFHFHNDIIRKRYFYESCSCTNRSFSVLLSTFCACSVPGTASTTSVAPSSISQDSASGAAPTQAPAQENGASVSAAPTATGFTNLSRLNNSIFGSGGRDGFYETYAAANGGVNVVYIDYATANEIYLCSAPNCPHDSDACNAWIPRRKPDLHRLSPATICCCSIGHTVWRPATRRFRASTT